MIFVNLDHHCFGPFVFLFVIRSCKEKNWRTHSCMQIGWFQTKRCRSSMSERFLIKMLILVVNSSKRHAMICCQWIPLQQRPRSSLWNSSRDVAGRFLKIGYELFASQPLMAYLTDCRCRWTWCLKRVAQLSLTQMFYRFNCLALVFQFASEECTKRTVEHVKLACSRQSFYYFVVWLDLTYIVFDLPGRW